MKFGNKISEWIFKKTGLKLREDCVQAINSHSIELVQILKKDPEWLANQFVGMFSTEEKDYEEKIRLIISNFGIGKL